MFDRAKIQQQFIQILNQNIGNRITPELGNGLLASLMAAVPEITMHVENADGEKVNVDNTTTASSNEPADSFSSGAGQRGT